MTSRELLKEARLRLEAEGRLKSGTPPAIDGWTVSADALGMLYRLASSPDHAAEALKLLHELQVHQVELGLQHEQIVSAEREMAESLAEYRNLYDLAPAGYFVVDRTGVFIDVNRAGIRLIGVGREAVAGRHFTWFLSAESRPAIQTLFTGLSAQNMGGGCDVRFNQTGIRAHITASAPAGGETVLMIAAEQRDSREP